MLLAHYLSLLHRSQVELADAFRSVAEAHCDDAEIARTSSVLSRQCDAHARLLDPFVTTYTKDADAEPDALHGKLFHGPRTGALSLLRDLHDLYLMATECDVVWTLVGQAAQGARDRDLLEVVSTCEGETASQMEWVKGQMKQSAPQVLVVTR